MQVSGRHHVSATEAFPAQRGVADRSAGGPDGALDEPLGADVGPGKRKVPWAGQPRAASHACTYLHEQFLAIKQGPLLP